MDTSAATATLARPFIVEVCCPSLNRPDELARLRASLSADCIFSPSVETQPRPLPLIVNELFGRSTGDIVIMAADHLEFRPSCLEVVRAGFARHFPDLDGVMGLNMCNLPRKAGITEYSFIAVGRKFIERFYQEGRFQGLFCPDYYHFYGDTEFGQLAARLERFLYDERAEVFTWHPNANNAPRDKTYSASRSRKAYDDEIWKKRREANLYWGETFVRVSDAPLAAPARLQLAGHHLGRVLAMCHPQSNILQWGAGDATLALARNLPAGARLTVVDHRSSRIDRLRSELGDRAGAVCWRCRPPTGAVGPLDRIAEEEESALADYLQAGNGETYDLVVITGLARAACLRRSKDLLAPAGIVVLADAQRAWYDAAKQGFFEYGHLGAGADVPGAQLWWAGLQEHAAPKTADDGLLPLVICYYTRNTPYEEEAKRLIASCERHGLEHRVVGVDSLGSWERNCSYKARFIHETWRSSGRAVLWVDADAVMHGVPELLRGVSADFGIHKTRGWEFASGTLFFNQTEGAGVLLDRWLARCRQFPQVWDQVSLDLAWEDVIATHPLETLWLPEPYCRIFDLMEGRSSAPAVVEHFQASRRLKTVVSTGVAPAAKTPVTRPLVAARAASRPRAWMLTQAEAALPADDNFIAPAYDRIVPGIGESLVQRWADGFAPILSGKEVLCVTPGVSSFWQLLRARGCDVHGLVRSPAAAAAGRLLWGDRVTVGEAKQMPYPDSRFEQVVALGVLEHLADAELIETLAEIRRVCGGLVVLILQLAPDPEPRWNGTPRTRAWWADRLAAAGFSVQFPGSQSSDAPLVVCVCQRTALPEETGVALLASQLSQVFACKTFLNLEWQADGSGEATPFTHAGGRSGASTAIALASDAARLPLADDAYETIVNLGSLNALSDECLGRRIAELHRVTARYCWIVLPAAPGRDQAWWEQRFLPAGFKKHALMDQLLADARENDPTNVPVMLVLEKQARILGVTHDAKLPPFTSCLSQSSRPVEYVCDTPADRLFPSDVGLVGQGRENGDRGAKCNPAAPQTGTPTVNAETIVVLTHNPKSPLLTSWLGQCRHKVVYETTSRLDYEFPDDTGLVVSWECYQEPRATLLCKAMERGIPTLLLADGILEYRNTFEHPQIAPGAIFQPALAHKVACIGRSQARVLAAWGNSAQIEITGSARFDRYAALSRRVRPATEPFRVLVTTAMTPFFTPEHHEQVRRSLLDLKNFFAMTPSIGDTPIQVEWRITQGLESEIGLDADAGDLKRRELAEVLQQVDAMISTPSTTMVEAMLLGLPVAVLDYTNVPHYVPAAWRITAAEHIAPTIAELTAPPAPKLHFQQMALHDTLECTTPAAPRLCRLAEEMIAHGHAAKADRRPLTFPPRMIPIGSEDEPAQKPRIDLAAWYPGHAQFDERQLGILQVEVGQLRAHAAQLEQKLRQLSTDIQWKAKLDAALLFAGTSQAEAVERTLLEGLRLAESTKNPSTILDALFQIAPPLAQFNPARAQRLLQVAGDLATKRQRPDLAAKARDLRGHVTASSLERTGTGAIPKVA